LGAKGFTVTFCKNYPHPNYVFLLLSPQSELPRSAADMKTTWKDIAPVPNSQEFLDIVLSRTQRRLPTQIRFVFASPEEDSLTKTQVWLQNKPYTCRKCPPYTSNLTVPDGYLVLHAKSQIHGRNILRKATSHSRWLSQTRRHSSLPP
jgi:hypothetical protein